MKRNRYLRISELMRMGDNNPEVWIRQRANARDKYRINGTCRDFVMHADQMTFSLTDANGEILIEDVYPDTRIYELHAGKYTYSIYVKEEKDGILIKDGGRQGNNSIFTS